MVSTYTPNVNFEEPARGDQVGTWDTPVNNNMTLNDLIVGANTTITGAGGSVVLAAAQFQCRQITFNSTLLASITVTFPSTFKKDYIIRHTCTGSSAFIITLQTTVAGGQVVACRPGNAFQVYNDGTNLTFVNLGTEVGGYWDYAGSSVPNWVSGCTVPPYLNCTGGTFSATTYPQLAIILGSTTLPDFAGRIPGYLNQGTGRITSSQGGVDGNTLFATGGSQQTTILSSNLPNSIPYKDVGHVHGGGTFNIGVGFAGGAVGPPSGFGSGTNTSSATIGITINPSTAAAGTDQPFTNLPPMIVGGLRLIRAA